MLEELARERRRGRGENEFASLLGRMLGLVFAGSGYSKPPQGKGKNKEVGWYEKGLVGLLLLPVRLPKKAVGWAVEKTSGTVKGIEKGWEEEKEIKMGGKGLGGGVGGNRRNNVLKA